MTTWVEYKDTCGRVVEVFGINRRLDDIAQDDFEKLRALYARKWGPTAVANEIGRARVLFKYAFDQGLMETPFRYGQGFKKPSHRNRSRVGQ